MTTLTAFNTMLKSFLEELAEVFPEHRDVATFLAGFDAFTAITPRKPMEVFTAAMSPHADLIMAKNPALFEKLQFPGIDFNAMWTSEGVTDATRDAIWQYLHTLFLLGTTVQSLPPELLLSIENVAHDCAEKMQGGQMDFSSMASALMGGLGPLASLAGGLSNTPALPKPKRAHRRSK